MPGLLAAIPLLFAQGAGAGAPAADAEDGGLEHPESAAFRAHPRSSGSTSS